MYLKEFQIKNFRGIEDAKLVFQEGLNVIIGENNSGKTAIIDALRICLGLGYQRRELRVRTEDFFVDGLGNKSTMMEFDLTFTPESQEEKGIFIEMLAVGENGGGELQLHVRFLREEKSGDERIRLRYWGGENEGQRLPEEMLDLLYFVHLGALRNSERDLSPGPSNRLGQLLRKLVSDAEEQTEYAETLNRVVQGDKKWKGLRAKAKKRINEHLEGATMLREHQQIDIDFVPLEYKKIVEQLKVYLPFIAVVSKEELLGKLKDELCEDGEWKKYFENPEEKQLKIKEEFAPLLTSEQTGSKTKDTIGELLRQSVRKFEVSQNGLGYNNVISIATVLGDIIERKKAEKEGYVGLLIEEPEAHLHPQLQDTLFNYLGKIAGKNIQVFITSHSPTITAKTDIDAISVMQMNSEGIDATPVENLPLDDSEKNKLRRFLDVTKSQLFFAKGVVLVEGISEALLLPVFAQKMGDSYDLDKNGIEVVNIGGVAFEPFAKLFNSKNKKRRLDVRCAIVTDDDKGRGKNVAEDEVSSRAEKARTFEGGNVLVWFADRTFEYELYQENGDLLGELHTTKMGHTRTEIDGAKEFVEKLEGFKDKAEFAQLLAVHLQNNTEAFEGFKVPTYLQKAIRWVIDGQAEEVDSKAGRDSKDEGIVRR
jgi:putative ATP-dependent endonuclease of OLD family